LASSTPEPPKDDLSGGSLATVDQERVNIGTRDQAHRHKLQSRAANVAIWLPLIMFGAAIVFAAAILRAYLCGDIDELDWHVTLFIAAFIVPPTIILTAFTRAAYESKHENSDNAPAIKFFKEIVNVIAEAWKAVKGKAE
jgi:hypothetical protein